ncbi:MAG TPA: hypothetical protein VF485_07195 [Sphingomonas sp.]
MLFDAGLDMRAIVAKRGHTAPAVLELNKRATRRVEPIREKSVDHDIRR